MSNNRKIDIAIIGAGASGLFLARLLSDCKDFNITIFEKNSQIATKLRASGGGKANIFNKHITPNDYNSPNFISKILEKVKPEDLNAQFEKFGLITIYDDEGRVYPSTQFSQTVVDVLTEFSNNNIRILLSTPVLSLKQDKNRWIVNYDTNYSFDIVILSSGSPANLIPKQQIGYNQYLDDLNLNVTRFEPSLVGFILKNYPKRLSGCRTKAIVSLYQDNKLIHKEKGEVIFKDDGISGIVIMNLSSYYRRLKTKKNCKISLNLTYWDENFDVKKYLKNHQSFGGIIHPKLLSFYKHKPFDIQNYTFEIKDTYSLQYAQVCSGGINLNEIDDNFASKRYKNLYITGEMLNIDGVCGGFNLFFAFSSAIIVAKTIQLQSVVTD